MGTQSFPVEKRGKKSQTLPTGWEELAQALLRNAGLGIYIVQDGRFQYVNPLFQNLTGYTENELLGESSLDLVHSEDREMVKRKAIANLKSKKGSVPYEYRLVKKNGEILWVLEEVTSINCKGKRATVGSFMDITARKELEEAIKYSEKRYRTVLDEIGDAYFEVDLKGSFTFVNDQMTQHLQYSKEELLGMNYKTFTPKEEIKNVYEAYNRVYRTGEPSLSLGHKIVRKDGTRGYNDVSFFPLKNTKGEIFGFRGISRDITVRKKAEEKLRESEEFNTSLLDNAPNPITVVNPDTSVRYVNPAFEKMTGFSLAEIIGIKAPYPWWPEKIRESYLTNIRGTIGDGRKKFKNEQILQNRKGKRFFVELNSSSVMSNGKVKYHIANWLDITDRKRAEEKLRESEEFSTSLLNNAPNPIEVVNLDTSTRYVNKAFEELTGFTSAEVVGRKPPYLWWPEESKKELGDTIKKDLADVNLPRMAEINVKKETVFQNKNEERLWAELSIAPLMYNGTTAYLLVNWVDITKRKQMEEELKVRAQLLNSVTDSILVHDFEGNFIYVNEMACRVHGYSREELMKMKLHQVIAPERISYLDSDFQDMLEKGQVIFESAHLCKDGSIMPAEVHGRTIESGGRKLILTVIRDITERKRLDEEREALLQEIRGINQKLEEANKELQDFVYIASHDLREPLRKVSSFGTLLQNSLKGKLDEDQQENFEFMVDGAQRMQDMIDALLTYSRLTTRAKPPEWVDLNKVIEDLEKLELATMLDETRGVIHVPKPLPSVQADLSQMHQLFQNLIGNGLKFHKEGIPPKTIIRAHDLADNMIRIEVEDNGIGIDKKYHSQLFTMFKRLHSREEYGGTGIGLASCKKIVERHGGDIGIKSTIGKGSTFWFTLPRKRCPSKKIKERR